MQAVSHPEGYQHLTFFGRCLYEYLVSGGMTPDLAIKKLLEMDDERAAEIDRDIKEILLSAFELTYIDEKS